LSDLSYLTKTVNYGLLPPTQGKYEIVKLLLKHGADASKKNRDGHTPLDLVKEGDQVRGVCTEFLRPYCGGMCQTTDQIGEPVSFVKGP
jgi:hypothetical protein